MYRLGILGSTRGSNMLGLIEAIAAKQLNASIEIVVSNKPQAEILARAKFFGIPAKSIVTENETRESFDAKLSQVLVAHQVDLIVLIGYMRILSPYFVQQWKNKIINIHPSLLPKHAGKMDLAVHQEVLDAGEKITGCTVHYVTEEVDAGPILVQKSCPVFLGDSAAGLKTRVQQLELAALIQAINSLSRV